MSAHRYPESVRDAVVGAYGKRSATLLAADHGCSVGAITYWWAAAKRDGLIQPLFGRFDGASVHAGRLSLDRRGGGGERIEPETPRDGGRCRRDRAARAAGLEGRG